MQYECYDKYGSHVSTFEIPIENQENIIVKYKDDFFRPVCYDLINKVVKCIPVRLIDCTSVEPDPGNIPVGYGHEAQ